MIKQPNLLTILTLIWVFLVPAGAGAADAVVNSIAFGQIPSGAGIEVRSFDDSEQNIVLEKDFAKEIEAAGYKPADGSSLILSFETRDEIGAWSTTDRRHILSFESKGGQGGGENAKARVNVFDSAAGGLLNKGRGGTSISTPSSYRIDASIEDKKSGKTLWQGWVIADLKSADGRELTRRMVPKLVGTIGRTVREEAFSLY